MLRESFKNLNKIVDDLEEAYPKRHFTIDGHLLGSIGECWIAEMFGLRLMPASNKGFDAVNPRGNEIEIKVTQGSRVAFRHPATYAIVGYINPDAEMEIIYNGPGLKIWNEFMDKEMPSNGQYSISTSKLKELDLEVGEEERVMEVEK